MAEIAKDQPVKLAEDKLRDAKLLLEAGRTSNAYYLAGYAIELMLKAVLSSQFKADTLPDKKLTNQVFTHNLKSLAEVARLDDTLSDRQKSDAAFRGSWEIVLKWTEESRYSGFELDQAKALIQAIEDQEHGVLPWLRGKL